MDPVSDYDQYRYEADCLRDGAVVTVRLYKTDDPGQDAALDARGFILSLRKQFTFTDLVVDGADYVTLSMTFANGAEAEQAEGYTCHLDNFGYSVEYCATEDHHHVCRYDLEAYGCRCQNPEQAGGVGHGCEPGPVLYEVPIGEYLFEHDGKSEVVGLQDFFAMYNGFLETAERLRLIALGVDQAETWPRKGWSIRRVR